jgi:hypothetical protein
MMITLSRARRAAVIAGAALMLGIGTAAAATSAPAHAVTVPAGSSSQGFAAPHKGVVQPDKAAAAPAATYTNYEVNVQTARSDQITVCGYNQSGAAVCHPWVASPNSYTLLSGWWWHGAIFVYGFQFNGGYNECAVEYVLPPSSSTNVIDLLDSGTCL